MQILDIYEAFWLDIFSNHKLSNKNLKFKLFNGFELLIYWLCVPVGKLLLEVPSLILGTISSLMVLIAWYYGILVMAMAAIGETDKFFGQPLPNGWSEVIGNLGSHIGGLSVWLVISIIMSFLPVDQAIDRAYFVKKYLVTNAAGIKLRSKIRQRILPVIEDVLSNYEQVTVLSHSFGVIISTDILADYHHHKLISLISLGSPLKILSYKERWINQEIAKCLKNQKIISWRDYYSHQDWLAARTPQPRGAELTKIESEEMPIYSYFWERLAGKTHLAYLYHPTWVKKALLKKYIQSGLDCRLSVGVRP
ncbi:MAG: hypothetical protein F6K24_58115 [Okeania sp. SIO2D1]|nr:hypothetical protein [Okeania sp. SIO2D1]